MGDQILSLETFLGSFCSIDRLQESRFSLKKETLTPKSFYSAMLTAAKMILHSHRLAAKHSCLASTGLLNLKPGSTNTVPGNVHFALDIRAGEDDRLMMLEHELKVDFDKIAKNEAVDDLNEGGIIGRGCAVEWTLDAPSEAIKFDEDCIRCVDESARELFGDKHEILTQAMISGAGQYEFPSPIVLPMSYASGPLTHLHDSNSRIERAAADGELNQ